MNSNSVHAFPISFGMQIVSIPDGWTLNCKSDDFLTATDPGGNQFFAGEQAGKTILIPKRIATEEDALRTKNRLESGTVFMDDRKYLEYFRGVETWITGPWKPI